MLTTTRRESGSIGDDSVRDGDAGADCGVVGEERSIREQSAVGCCEEAAEVAESDVDEEEELHEENKDEVGFLA